MSPKHVRDDLVTNDDRHSELKPPLPSPEPPEANGHDTGEFLVAKTELRAVEKEVTKLVTSGDVKWFVATMASVAVAAVVLVGWLDARAAEKVSPVEKRVEKLEVGQQQLALDGARNTVMLEMLVKERRMEPPPPAPRVVLPDGGL